MNGPAGPIIGDPSQALVRSTSHSRRWPSVGRPTFESGRTDRDRPSTITFTGRTGETGRVGCSGCPQLSRRHGRPRQRGPCLPNGATEGSPRPAPEFRHHWRPPTAGGWHRMTSQAALSGHVASQLPRNVRRTTDQHVEKATRPRSVASTSLLSICGPMAPNHVRPSVSTCGQG